MSTDALRVLPSRSSLPVGAQD